MKETKTELYVVGVVLLLAILIATGVIKSETLTSVASNLDAAGDAIPQLQNSLSKFIEKLGALGIACLTALAYLWSRTKVKSTREKTLAKEEFKRTSSNDALQLKLYKKLVEELKAKSLREFGNKYPDEDRASSFTSKKGPS